MTAPVSTFGLRPRIQLARDSLRPTRAEIDLAALEHNLHVVRRVAGSARVLAVIKADAYGHGVVPVAHRLEEHGVDGFGVALAEEGLELREAGIRSEILVLNGVYGRAHREVLRAGLTPVVYDLAQVEAFHHAAGGLPFAVHLKIDSGMSRLGVPLNELDTFLDGFGRYAPASIGGVLTHFSSADSDPEETSVQLSRFRQALWRLGARGHRPRTIHAANTAATFLHPDSRCGMVRTGIALFGHAPGATELKPTMRLRSEVIAVRQLAAGTRVGYDGTFVADRPTKLVTVPIGYGDGLMRSASNRAVALVGGVRCPVVGNVSMDLTTVDVTEAPGVAVGDEVVFMGEQGNDRITAFELAEACGTLPYEVLTNVSRRVPRFYETRGIDS